MQKIEELRVKLEELVKTKGVNDDEVMAASKMLDAVLNEYCRLLKRKVQRKRPPHSPA